MSSPATGVDSFQPMIAPPKAFSSTPRASVHQKVLWSWQLMGLGVSQCLNSSSGRTILACVPQRAPTGSAPNCPEWNLLSNTLSVGFFPFPVLPSPAVLPGITSQICQVFLVGSNMNHDRGEIHISQWQACSHLSTLGFAGGFIEPG